MALFTTDIKQFQYFIDDVQKVINQLKNNASKSDIEDLNKIIKNFKNKTDDFYREDRKLNIGVVGQVKAGKSSFLNTLLFGGKEVLPKASTPKTATLTKMEYSEKNIIQIEYYSKEEWEDIEDCALEEEENDESKSSREIMSMVRKNGIDPYVYLNKGFENIEFDTYNHLIENLNNYVGEDGKYTPIVKSVTLYLNNEDFKGLSIVDTPGLNDPIISRTIRTKEFMELCDVVFFLSQSTSFLDTSDWHLLSAQLPQKGVKRLVLIASKYDSGLRDVLKEKEDLDDEFLEEWEVDTNTTDSIPKACQMLQEKLGKRAKNKVQEFIKELEMRGSSKELIEVIKQIEQPILISSICNNMSKKNIFDYDSEENNIFSGLNRFFTNSEKDLALIGNFSEVYKLFDEVVEEKERILEEKSSGFIPTAKDELRNLLYSFKERDEKKLVILEGNDKNEIAAEKTFIEKQMNQIKADISTVFTQLEADVETEKADATQSIRELCRDFTDIKTHTGTETKTKSYRVSDSKWYNPFSWGTSHRETYSYTESYTYFLAADALENLRKYTLESTNYIEKVFTEAIQLKTIKRKLMNVVVNNFDMGSETFDASVFKVMVEKTINQIEFPIFKIDVTNKLNSISNRFKGEIRNSDEKNKLISVLSSTLSEIFDVVLSTMLNRVKEMKEELKDINKYIQDEMLHNIQTEFDSLLKQFDDKEKEINGLKGYITLLDAELKKM